MNKNALISDLLLTFPETPAVNAAVDYVRRRDHAEHPAGGLNGSNRWYPAETENFDFAVFACMSLSRRGRFEYMHVCRSARHCAHRRGADVKATRLIANRIDRACLIEDPQDATAWLSAEVKKILAHAALKAAQLET